MTQVGKNLGRHYKSQGPNSSEALDASAQVEEGVLDTLCALVPLRKLLPEHHLPGGGRSAPGDLLALFVVDPSLTLHCAPPWDPPYLAVPSSPLHYASIFCGGVCGPFYLSPRRFNGCSWP